MTKYAARGLVLSMNGNAIGQATSIGEAGSTRELIDASAYGDDWKDYVLGQQDGSELALVVALDPANSGHDDLKEAYDNANVVNFDLTHDESGFDVGFPAIITTLTRGGDLGGLLQLSATLKIVNPGVTDNS